MQNDLSNLLGRHMRHALVSRRLRTTSISIIASPFRHLPTSRRLHNDTSALALPLEGPYYPSLPHNQFRRYPFVLDKRSAEWHELLEEQDAARQVDILRDATRAATTYPIRVLHFLLCSRYLPPALLGQCVDHIKTLHAATHIRDRQLRHLVKRLTYHACQVSPEALEAISDIFLQHMPLSLDCVVRESETSDRVLRRRNMLCNKVLSMLATASNIRPYDSSPLQEAALFKVLQYMVDHKPHLTVYPEGYRALARVQLRLPKTDQENEWASLKASSWPPWKQDRHAMDSKLGPEYGISKAKATLQRKQEAGYKLDSWDEAASTYAGWDTDGTPTIQTRRDMMPRMNQELRPLMVWVARISATRTAQEAWAMWLQCSSQSDKVHDMVALAVLKRLSQEESRLQGCQPPSLPGDGSEIHAPPSSVHLHTYTRTPPPSTHDFFRILLRRTSRKMHPYLARCFITSASTWQTACEYVDELQYMYLGHRTGVMQGGAKNAQDGRALPTPILAAVAIALCRFVQVPNPESIPVTESGLHNIFTKRVTTARGIGYGLHTQHNFVRAVWMIQQLPRCYQSSPWRAVLRVLSDAKKCIRMLSLSPQMIEMIGRGGSLSSGLTEAEQLRLRYNMLTLQNYQLSLQVQELILQQIPLDLHMLYELAAITARCAQTYHEMLLNCVDAQRGSVWRAKYQQAGMLETMEHVISNAPAKLLLRSFRIYAGLERRYQEQAGTTIEVDAELKLTKSKMTNTSAHSPMSWSEVDAEAPAEGHSAIDAEFKLTTSEMTYAPICWSEVDAEATGRGNLTPDRNDALDTEVKTNVAIYSPASWTEVDAEATGAGNPTPNWDDALDPEIKTNVAIEPALLHQWIRATGMYGDYAAMLQLLRQICEDETIAIVQDASPGASRLLRASIVAVRVLLERSWMDEAPVQTSQESDSSPRHASLLEQYRQLCQPASEEQLREASDLLVKKFGEDLGSWASDEDVEEYCEGHFKFHQGGKYWRVHE